MQVSLLPSRIHVSGLDDIWHMSLGLNTGNVVTFDTTDLSLLSRSRGRITRFSLFPRSAVISGTLRCRVIVTEIVAQTRVVAVKAPVLSRGFVGSNELDPSPLPRGRGEQCRWLRC
jgi:hypothetical protein